VGPGVGSAVGYRVEATDEVGTGDTVGTVLHEGPPEMEGENEMEGTVEGAPDGCVDGSLEWMTDGDKVGGTSHTHWLTPVNDFDAQVDSSRAERQKLSP